MSVVKCVNLSKYINLLRVCVSLCSGKARVELNISVIGKIGWQHSAIPHSNVEDHVKPKQTQSANRHIAVWQYRTARHIVLRETFIDIHFKGDLIDGSMAVKHGPPAARGHA